MPKYPPSEPVGPVLPAGSAALLRPPPPPPPGLAAALAGSSSSTSVVSGRPIVAASRKGGGEGRGRGLGGRLVEHRLLGGRVCAVRYRTGTSGNFVAFGGSRREA